MGQVDAFEHEGQIRQAQLRGNTVGTCLNRQFERPGFETLVVQTVPAPVPEQNFNAGAIAVKENKKMARKRVLTHNTGYERRQAVKAFAKVGRLQADERLYR